METCLVTGGAGFIGSHLVRALLARGERVRVFDNFSSGRAENLSGLNGALQVVEGDLRDPARVSEAVQDVSRIYHLAAFVSVPRSMQEPQACFNVNVQGTLHLLEAARAAGADRAVLASSAAVYGDSQALPLSEAASLQTLSPYAVSKQMNEICAGLYSRALDLPVTALRFFNVYGPRQSPLSDYAAAIPIFIRKLLDNQPPTVFGDGGQQRDFIFVSDVVRALILAAELPQAEGEVFNVCTGQAVSLLDLLEVLSDLLPEAPAPQFASPRPGDIYRSLGDPGRAAQVLGFKAQVSLVDGLHETIHWMRVQG